MITACAHGHHHINESAADDCDAGDVHGIVRPLKICSTCNRVHDAVSWAALKLVGTQKVDADEEGPAQELELRNCTCGSTLAIDLADLSKAQNPMGFIAPKGWRR